MLETIGMFALYVIAGLAFWGVLFGIFYLLNKLLGDKILLGALVVVMASMSGKAIFDVIKLLMK